MQERATFTIPNLSKFSLIDKILGIEISLLIILQFEFFKEIEIVFPPGAAHKSKILNPSLISKK